MGPSQSQSCVKALNQMLFSIGQNSNDVTQVQGSYKSRKTWKTSPQGKSLGIVGNITNQGKSRKMALWLKEMSRKTIFAQLKLPPLYIL